MSGKSFRHIPYRFASMLAASMRAGDEDTNTDNDESEDTSEDDGKNTEQDKSKSAKKSEQDDANSKRSKKAGGKGDDDSSDDEDESVKPKYTQKQFDEAFAARLNREREKQKREEKAKKGEFEELYTTTKAELETAQSDLEKLTKRAEAAEAQVHRVIDSQIKDWPSSIREMDPGKDAPIEQRTQFVEKGKKLAAELLSNKKAPDLEGGKHNGKNGKDGKDGKTVVSDYMKRQYPGPKSARKKD